MNHFKHAIALFALLFLIPVSAAAGISLKVSVVDGKLVKPYSGRVYVQIAPVTENGPVEPRLVGRWFNVPLIVAKDVSGWDGGAIALEDSALHYPSSVDDLAPGDYRAQAYVRLDKFSSNPGQGAADLVSAPVAFTHTEGADSDLALVIDRGVEVATPEDTDRVKFIEMRSDLLSDFHGFDYPVQAAVQLPKNWDPAKAAEYPVLYYVGGYGDDHIAELRAIQSFGELMDELVVVMPNGMNMRGHSVFADSDSIGPWGTALMTEMAPAIEAKFGLAGAAKRYVTGISSGGWASLWLQIQWPEEFQHTWSFVPDPVDFTDFQGINLYRDGDSFYKTNDGERRPVGQFGEMRLWYEDFIRHEWVLGPGMQIHSFEATFSPRAADGAPALLFDRDTGLVDPVVAEAFKRYDISVVLKENWETLGPQLEGKLTIIAGAADNFFLQGAVYKLRDTMKELGSDADIRIIEGLGHAFHPPTLDAMVKDITGK